MYRGKKIAVIIPALNEIGKIEDVLRRMPMDIVDLVVVSDDNSTDGTVDYVLSLSLTITRIRILTSATNRGVGAAIRSGYNFALENECDVICVVAGNNKDFPEDLHVILDPILDDKADFVQGSRFLHENPDFGPMPSYRIWATKSIHPKLVSFRVRKKITESTNGFRAITSRVLLDKRVRLELSILDKYALEPYLLMKSIKLGYRHTEVGVKKVYPDKHLGQTKMKPITGWWSILWITFTPLWLVERLK